MIIDAWMQHPTRRFLADEMFAPLWRWTGQEPPAEDPPIEATVAALDGGGVDFGLLSAWHGPQGPLIGNDAVAGWVSEHPDRFAGLAAVDLARPAEAVRELRHCVGELGFKGLRMLPWLWEAPPTDRRFYPLYAACVELGVPFCTQVGHTGPLRPSEVGRPIPYIDQVAIDFPELVIVAGHIGYPWTEEMIAVARKHEHVYIDTSAYTAKRYPPELVRYMQGRGGRRKVLFGSNHPMIAPGDALADLDGLGLDDEARALFLGGNAARVFGLGRSANDAVPTILEWGGGPAAFRLWLDAFYDLVELEPELAPLFGGTVSEEHRAHVTTWWVEVMGGPAAYTADHGGYEHMLARHRGLAITEHQRLRFVTLLSQAADAAGLPRDPEFRAAIMGYAEWGTRLALHNSQPGAEVVEHAPVPRWGWGVAPPYRP